MRVLEGNIVLKNGLDVYSVVFKRIARTTDTYNITIAKRNDIICNNLSHVGFPSVGDCIQIIQKIETTDVIE